MIVCIFFRDIYHIFIWRDKREKKCNIWLFANSILWYLIYFFTVILMIHGVLRDLKQEMKNTTTCWNAIYKKRDCCVYEYLWCVIIIVLFQNIFWSCTLSFYSLIRDRCLHVIILIWYEIWNAIYKNHNRCVYKYLRRVIIIVYSQQPSLCTLKKYHDVYLIIVLGQNIFWC